MLTVCPDCGRMYNDEYRWTLCPHRSLSEPANPHPKKEPPMPENPGNQSAETGVPTLPDQRPGTTPGPATSNTMASCGRVVHVRSMGWSGPRPALVIDATMGPNGEDARVEVNPETRRGQESKEPRLGTVNIPLYDPLTDAQRAALPHPIWAEWMPFQKGQAQKNDELTPRLARCEADIASIREGLGSVLPDVAGTSNSHDARLAAVEDHLRKSTSFGH